MVFKINTYTFASTVYSIITVIIFFIFSRLFNEIIIFYLGIPFALSIFLFSLIVLRRDSNEWSFRTGHMQIPKFLLGTLTILCMLTVFFIPAYDGSILEWANIPLMNWLRYVSSILLTMFLPGYFLLKILDSRNSVELSATIPLSYVLSMFITFITGFGLLLTENSISSIATYSLIAVNLALMAFYYVRPSLQKGSAININLVELTAVLATLLVTAVGNIYVMNNTLPLSGGDMWRQHAQSLQYSKGFPIHEGMLIPSYPYLFNVHLAMMFQLSGLPSPISYQALFALSFIPVLSFCSFIKKWFPEKSLHSITILLTPLLGFGSLYAIFLKARNQTMLLPSVLWNAIRKTYDINDIMIITPTNSNVVPILYVTLPTLFMFLYLLRKNLNNVAKLLLFALLVAVSYLGHIDASFFMALTLLLYTIIMKGKGVREGALGGILGLLIVFLVDISAPARNYIWNISSVSLSRTITFFVTLLLFALSYTTSLLVRRFHINCKLVTTSFRKVFSLIPWVILYVYLFSLMAWLYALPTYDAVKFGHYSFTPFFIWPTRFGPIGLLLILCLVLYLKEIAKDKSLTFFLAVATSGFALEQLANYYPIYPSYRFGTLTFIGAVLLAAYGIVKSLELLARNKRILVTALLIVMLIPGMLSSSFFYYDRASLRPDINSYELDALSFVGRKLPSNSSVLTFTADSATKLETFGGINTIQVMQRWDYIFSKTRDPSILLYLLGASNVKYIYLSQHDLEALNRSENMLYDILVRFPIALRNEDVTIYGVPRIVPPSKQTNFIILNFLECDTATFEHTTSKSELLLQTIPSFLQLNYTISALPVEANVAHTIVESFQNTSEWAITEGIGEISLDEKDYIGKPGAISINNMTADKTGYFAVGKEDRWDFTQFDCLQLWIRVSDDIDGEVKVVLIGEAETWIAWLIQDFPKNEWFTLTLPLTTPDLESSIKLDLSDIRRIAIGFQKLKPSTKYSFFKTDEIRGMNLTRFLPHEQITNLLSHSATIMLTHDPNFDASSLLQLAESGSKIVVFNTFATNKGFFFNLLQLEERGDVESNEIALPTKIDLPKVQVPSVSTKSLDVSPVFYYKLDGTTVAPFMIVKEIGRGEIIYIILPSSVIITLERTLSSLMTIFKDLVNTRELKVDKYKYSSNHFGSYNTLEGSINLTGKIEIDTEHMLNINPLKAQTLQIRIENTSRVLTNITIASLKTYGSTRIITENSSMTVQACSVSSYLTIFSNEAQKSYLLKLSDNAIADLSIVNSSGIFDLHITGGSLLLNTSRLSILLRHPSIKTQGETYFESARIHYLNPYVPLAGAVRNSLKISGDTFFFTLFATKDLMIVDNFSYDGTTIASKTSTTQSNQLDISWLSLLASPNSFVFHLILLTFALLFIMQKRHTGAQNV